MCNHQDSVSDRRDFMKTSAAIAAGAAVAGIPTARVHAKDAQEYDPIAAAQAGGPMTLNKEWYEELLKTKPSWKLVSTQYIKPCTGIAVDVPAGHTIRITQAEGPQINDINFLSADIKDASGERYDLGYTIGIEGMLLPRFARAWSCLPWLRPMATVIDDNIDAKRVPKGTWPIWTGGHCSGEVLQSTGGLINYYSCHSNFIEAARSRGLDESIAALNNVNIFQPMGFVERKHPGGGMTHTIAGRPSVSVKGEFVEFYAEIDLLVLAVHCPYGDQSTGVKDAKHFTNTVEVFDTKVKPQPGPKWHDYRPAHAKALAKYRTEGEPDVRPKQFGPPE